MKDSHIGKNKMSLFSDIHTLRLHKWINRWRMVRARFLTIEVRLYRWKWTIQTSCMILGESWCHQCELIFSFISSVQFSRSVVSDSLRPHESQLARPPCPSPTHGVYSNSCPSSRWCHPAISSSVVPSPPVPNPSQHQGLFQWVNSSHQVAKVLEFQLQH